MVLVMATTLNFDVGDVLDITPDSITPVSSGELKLCNEWIQSKLVNEIRKGATLRTAKPKRVQSKELKIVDIKCTRRPIACGSIAKKRSYSPKRYNVNKRLSTVCKTNLKDANNTPPRRKHVQCSTRIIELAAPTKRHCIETWRNRSNMLPPFMLERLKKYINEEIPVPRINDAITCFERRRKTVKKFKTKEKNISTRYKSEFKILSGIFGGAIVRRLITLMTIRNIPLNNEWQRVADTVEHEIFKMTKNYIKQNNFHKKMTSETANKVTVWIANILNDSANKLLEDELRDLEEEEGPVLDFIDDLIDQAINTYNEKIALQSPSTSSSSSSSSNNFKLVEPIIEDSDTKISSDYDIYKSIKNLISDKVDEEIANTEHTINFASDSDNLAKQITEPESTSIKDNEEFANIEHNINYDLDLENLAKQTTEAESTLLKGNEEIANIDHSMNYDLDSVNLAKQNSEAESTLLKDNKEIANIEHNINYDLNSDNRAKQTTDAESTLLKDNKKIANVEHSINYTIESDNLDKQTTEASTLSTLLKDNERIDDNNNGNLDDDVPKEYASRSIDEVEKEHDTLLSMTIKPKEVNELNINDLDDDEKKNFVNSDNSPIEILTQEEVSTTNATQKRIIDDLTNEQMTISTEIISLIGEIQKSQQVTEKSSTDYIGRNIQFFSSVPLVNTTQDATIIEVSEITSLKYTVNSSPQLTDKAQENFLGTEAKISQPKSQSVILTQDPICEVLPVYTEKISVMEMINNSQQTLQKSLLSFHGKQIKFSSPNHELLSTVDEVWPHDIPLASINVCQSVTKSITSLGNISEDLNDEDCYVNPSNIDSVTKSEVMTALYKPESDKLIQHSYHSDTELTTTVVVKTKQDTIELKCSKFGYKVDPIAAPLWLKQHYYDINAQQTKKSIIKENNEKLQEFNRMDKWCRWLEKTCNNIESLKTREVSSKNSRFEDWVKLKGYIDTNMTRWNNFYSHTQNKAGDNENYKCMCECDNLKNYLD